MLPNILNKQKRSRAVGAARLMGLNAYTPMKNAGAASYLGHTEMELLPSKPAAQMNVLTPGATLGTLVFIVGISRIGGGDIVL